MRYALKSIWNHGYVTKVGEGKLALLGEGAVSWTYCRELKDAHLFQTEDEARAAVCEQACAGILGYDGAGGEDADALIETLQTFIGSYQIVAVQKAITYEEV